MRQERNRRGLDRRRVRRLPNRPPERLNDDERVVARRVLDANATVAAAHALVHRFRTLLQDKDAAGPEPWPAEAQASGSASLAGVANGMHADNAVVVATVTRAWTKDCAAYCTLSA